MLDNLNSYQILLASNSPRRRELLAGLGITYQTTAIPDVDESFPQTMSAFDVPVHIACNKAAAYASHMERNTLLITADTIVWCDGRVLGKPLNAEEAKSMLRLLSGKTHEVITGVCLRTMEKESSFSCVSEVTFAPLTDTEIEHYVTNFHPLDKAGSYGIQEWIGFIGVESIRGCYYNIMGLPVQRIYKELQQF